MPTDIAVPSTQTTLILKRTYPVPQQRVFDAWTKPEMLRQWFAAGDDYVGSLAEVDFRVGGTYRIAMSHVTKNVVHTATGVYREIRSPERLVFTWKWDGSDAVETLVTIEFRAKGSSTEMVFTHEFFPDADARNRHETGWVGCFDKLGRVLEG